MSAETVSVLSLHVRPGCEDELVSAFSDHGVLEAARESCGLISAQLLRPATDGAAFVVVARWPSPEGYACWLESDERARLSDALGPLLAAEPVAGDLYAPVVELGT